MQAVARVDRIIADVLVIAEGLSRASAPKSLPSYWLVPLLSQQIDPEFLPFAGRTAKLALRFLL
jgi:hypothetical protein